MYFNLLINDFLLKRTAHIYLWSMKKMFVQEILHNSYNRKSFVEHDI